jgi:hypothetical protein
MKAYFEVNDDEEEEVEEEDDDNCQFQAELN